MKDLAPFETLGGLALDYTVACPMKLSVVMPVYNNEPFLAEAIESILGQTYRDFELLVCDDGSRDRTLETARRYEAKKEKK